ncbi:hypothetical protein OS493_017296 [Desmophyllum pertusum]|uniref:Uncharacterized protein n=1 Tax=Desmophyllum pertusum TaxID=174260 RepID=A0A9X0A4S4_9CNID|nr:hypothetical protein OS493_017296 [Desmophyllum pertusum]
MDRHQFTNLHLKSEYGKISLGEQHEQVVPLIHVSHFLTYNHQKSFHPQHRRLPDEFPSHILRSVDERNALGDWPTLLAPSISRCELCGTELGEAVKHPGTDGEAVLITSAFPFRKIAVRVKICKKADCKAMHQAFPSDIEEEDLQNGVSGFLHNVSPIQQKDKNVKWFDCEIQIPQGLVRGVCFDPSPSTWEHFNKVAESKSPVKMTNFETIKKRKGSELDIIIRKKTKLEEIKDDPFDRSDVVATTTTTTIGSLKDLKAGQLLTVTAMANN